MTDEEVRTLWDSLSGNTERLAKAKEEGLYNSFERNRDEYNDILNYAPTAEQQTYDLGMDDAGNPILGNTLNDAFMQSQPQPKQEKSLFGNIREYLDNDVPERIDDYDGEDVNRDDNMDSLTQFPLPVNVGKVASNLYDEARNSKLYVMHVYNMKGEDWLEKCRWIQEKTGIDATNVTDEGAFQKLWQAAREIEQKEKLATDENGHTDMDKVRDWVPYLGDLEEARDVAGALMILDAAQGFKSINDVYESEFGKIGGSIGVGLERTKLMLQKQLVGAPAWLRGLVNNEGLTAEEVKEILRNAEAERNLLQYSYNSIGGALGGIAGNTAEQLAIQAPGWVMPKNIWGQLAAGAIMAAQIGSQDYIDLVSELDENGKPKYTPRQASAIAAVQAPVEAAIELLQLNTIRRWITGSGTAKKLIDIYKNDAALASGTTKELIGNMARELVDGGIKAGAISGGTEIIEEFTQSLSNDIIENAGNILVHGKDADVKTAEDILTDAAKEAVEAVPSVLGFTAFGGAAHGVSTYRRFRAATSSRMARDVMENAQDSAIIDGVGEHLDEIAEIKDKNLREAALDSINEKHGMKEREVDIKTLAALNQQDIVDQVVEASGTSEEEVQACMNGTGLLTVKTSVLQQLSHDMTPEQRETLSQHRTAQGRETTYKITERAKYLSEVLKNIDTKKVQEDAAAVEGFVNSTFEDENDRQLALDIIAANMANPALEVRNRQRANKAALDEVFEPVKATLRSGMKQGVDIIRDEETGRGVRLSNNAEWYRNWYADHGKPPTEEQLEEIAYENLTGTATRYALDSMMIPGLDMQELKDYYEGRKAEIDNLREEQARLSKMLDVFSNYNSGEFMAQAAMPEGAREAYQAIYDALKASGIKAVSTNARVNAILAARIAERVAQEHRAAGEKDVKAVDVLPEILGGVFSQEDAKALSQFAGENAETADKVKLAEAQQMEENGAAADEIYKKTGWFKGLDNKWRFEIKDNLNDVDLFGLKKLGELPLARVYYNADLFDAYPILRTVKVNIDPNMEDQTYGQADVFDLVITLNENHLDEERMPSTVVHEVAHMIQKIEGFAAGGSAEDIRDALKTLGRYKQEYDTIDDYDLYLRIGGEQEAREVMRRARIEQNLAHAQERYEEAQKSGNDEEIRRKLFSKTMYERMRDKMPTPHTSDAVIVFDGEDMPYAYDKKQDEGPAGEKTAAEKNGRLNQGGFSNAQNKRISRGQYSPEMNIVSLFQDADQSTFMHEMSHFYLNEMERLSVINPDGQAAKDFATASAWAEWHEGDAEAFKGTASYKDFADLEKQILNAQKDGNKDKADELKWVWRQEKFARGFEDYLRSGKAPTNTLRKIFRTFKTWLTKIYKDVIGAGVKPSAEVEAVMARMVATDEEIEMQNAMKEAESVARTNPDLLDKETSAMYARWEQEAKEEAKEKLLKELIKEQEAKDIAAHMEEFEVAERERLAFDPAFAVAAMIDRGIITEDEVADTGLYDSVEAWKKDLEKKGGDYEAALSASLEAERERYTKEMPNQERISEMAEEALATSDYSQQLAALEAEILKRRANKYKGKTTYLLSRALEDLENAIAGDPKTLHSKILALRYAHRWNQGESEQIDKMNKIVDDVTLAEEQKREKLQAEYQKLKESTVLNTEWLRGVRDATKGATKEIKEFAVQQLNSMSVKDATNVRHWINEAKKAAQESARHLTNAARKNNGKDKEDSGNRNFELARQAKMRQTYYTIMAAESLKYRRELQRIQNDMKRVQKGLVKAKGEIDASTRYYLGHIQYMLGFRGKDALMPQNLMSFAALFNSMKNIYDDKTGATENIGDIDSDIEIPQWLMELAISQKRVPTKYADYTIEELQDMRKVVDMLYKTSRNKNALLSENFEGKQVGEVENELREDFQKTVTVEAGDEGISEFFAELLKPVVMLKALGPMWKKYIYDPLFDAFEMQERMSMQAAEELNKLFNNYWTKKERRQIRNKELSVTMPDGTKLTKENVLAMALNWGNEGNRLRLIQTMFPNGGVAYPEVDVANLFKQVLTEKDWEFVQQAWDYINTFGDKVNDVVEKLTGVPMTRVEPLEFIIETSDGKILNLRGGYYPIAYDPKKSSVTAEQELTTSQKAFGGAVFSTGMGSTKNRAQAGPQEAKLLLSMDVLFRHVNQQIHIATMRLACRDVYKLLQNRGIRSMIESSIGMNAYRELKRWVENVWQEPIERMSSAKKWAEAGRKNTVAAIMAYRTSVSVLNTLPNFVLMTRELGPINALQACLKCWSTKGSRAWILEESPFMRNRANNIDRDIKRAQKNSFTPDNPFQDMVARTSGWLMEQTDMIFSLPTYYWTYKQTLNDALEKGMTQKAAAKEAHRAAEDTVRKIFGSADTVDQSYYQRTTDVFEKAITPFYTYVSTQANAVWEEYMKARYQGSKAIVADNGEIKKQKKTFMERWGAMAHAVLFTYILETLIEQMMRDAISYVSGDDDDKLLDEKEFAKRWAAQGLTTFTAAIPWANMAGELVGNFIMGKNYNLRGFGVVSAAQERVAKVGADIGKLAEGKGDAIEIGRDIAKAAGSFTAFPDVFTDAIFNAARAYKDNYGIDEWFIRSLFDKKLKPKKKGR
jgi:hypothetical protein